MGGEAQLPPIRVRDDPGADNPPRSAPYREPVELACFSKSRHAGVTYDSSMLKQYARPSVPFDLSEGFDTFRDRDRDVARPAALDPIFGALRAKGVEDKELAAADVVTWRGNFAKLLSTPWNAREPWHMECEAVHDVLVLNVLEPEECLAKERKRNSDPARHREKLMCYWGFSFEEACTGGASKYAEPVDCADAFCAVVRAGVGRHRLVLGGEVDCWDGEKAGLPGYVELKTTRVMDAHAQVARFERDKLLKWWAQSFAVGVRRILVGFRDDDGFVRKLQTLDTLKLPGYAARHAGAWDPKTALAFADKVLTDLKELFGSGRVPAGARVRLEYEPRRDKNEVRVVLDEAIPDFIPAEARRALARAAAIRAAGGGATSSGSRGGKSRSGSLSKSRGSGGGGSVAGGSGGGGSVGGGSVGGGSVGGPASFLAGGTAASAKASRGVVFRAPDPKHPTYDPTKHSLRGDSLRGSGAGASGSERRRETVSEKSGGTNSVLSGDAQDSSEKRPGDTTRDDALRESSRVVFESSRFKETDSRKELEDTNASTRAEAFGGETKSPYGDAATRRPDVEPPAPAARFVHWGVGGGADERGAGTGGAAHERRRRRRHERSQTPVPGGAAPRESRAEKLVLKNSGGAGPESGGGGGGDAPPPPPHSTAPSRADRGDTRQRDDRVAGSVDGQPSGPAPPPHRVGDASSGGRFAGGHKGGAHPSFGHPIVAGPGVGDPFKLAASKLAYARALGPAAMSFLMGFTPGDPGWRGDDAGTTEAHTDVAAEKATPLAARGEETRVFSRAAADSKPAARDRDSTDGHTRDASTFRDVRDAVRDAGDAVVSERDAGTPSAMSPKKETGGDARTDVFADARSARFISAPVDKNEGFRLRLSPAASADEKKSVGLDPRAFAFDPLNPAATPIALAPTHAGDADKAMTERSGGSLLSGDGPQGSHVSAVSKRESKSGGTEASNADAAGSDVEDAEAAVKRTKRG